MHRDDVLASDRQRSCRTSQNEAVRLGAPFDPAPDVALDTVRVTSPPYRLLLVAAIALFAIALAAELAHLRSQRELHYQVALVTNVGGVLLALGAAALGAMGRAALPRTDEARRLAVQELLFHALALLMFGASAAQLYRGWTERALVAPDTHAALAFGLLGLVAIAIAVALGWALAHAPADDPRLLRPRLLRRRSRQLAFDVRQLRNAAAGFP